MGQDFEGQRAAEVVMQVVLGLGAMVAFGAGYATQRLSVTMLLFAVTFLTGVLVSPIVWQSERPLTF